VTLFLKGKEAFQMVAASRNTWNEVPGGGTTDVAVAGVLAGGGGDIYLVGKGINDKGIYLNHYTGNSDTWSGWYQAPGGGHTDAAIAAAGIAVYDGYYVLHLYMKGLNDHIYWNPVQL
jgi:hypothetical protein